MLSNAHPPAFHILFHECQHWISKDESAQTGQWRQLEGNRLQAVTHCRKNDLALSMWNVFLYRGGYVIYVCELGGGLFLVDGDLNAEILTNHMHRGYSSPWGVWHSLPKEYSVRTQCKCDWQWLQWWIEYLRWCSGACHHGISSSSLQSWTWVVTFIWIGHWKLCLESLPSENVCKYVWCVCLSKCGGAKMKSETEMHDISDAEDRVSVWT